MKVTSNMSYIFIYMFRDIHIISTEWEIHIINLTYNEGHVDNYVYKDLDTKGEILFVNF